MDVDSIEAMIDEIPKIIERLEGDRDRNHSKNGHKRREPSVEIESPRESSVPSKADFEKMGDDFF